jgi:hypothetical protein
MRRFVRRLMLSITLTAWGVGCSTSPGDGDDRQAGSEAGRTGSGDESRDGGGGPVPDASCGTDAGGCPGCPPTDAGCDCGPTDGGGGDAGCPWCPPTDAGSPTDAGCPECPPGGDAGCDCGPGGDAGPPIDAGCPGCPPGDAGGPG